MLQWFCKVWQPALFDLGSDRSKGDLWTRRGVRHRVSWKPQPLVFPSQKTQVLGKGSVQTATHRHPGRDERRWQGAFTFQSLPCIGIMEEHRSWDSDAKSGLSTAETTLRNCFRLIEQVAKKPRIEERLPRMNARDLGIRKGKTFNIFHVQKVGTLDSTSAFWFFLIRWRSTEAFRPGARNSLIGSQFWRSVCRKITSWTFSKWRNMNGTRTGTRYLSMTSGQQLSCLVFSEQSSQGRQRVNCLCLPDVWWFCPLDRASGQSDPGRSNASAKLPGGAPSTCATGTRCWFRGDTGLCRYVLFCHMGKW